MNFVFFVHFNIVTTHTHNLFQLVLLVEAVHPTVNMIQVINKETRGIFLLSIYKKPTIKTYN